MARDWRLTYEAEHDGVINDMTFCLHEAVVEPGIGELSAGTVVADVNSWLGALWAATFTGNVACKRLIARELGASEPETAELALTGAGSLAVGTGALPWACAPRIKITTAVATRSGRGRFHTPWPQSASYLLSGKNFANSGALWTALTALANALIAGHTVTHDLMEHHYSLRVWSRRHGISYDAISAAPVQDISYLRSRTTAP